ncbi:hypothetical protein [Niallia taxi]|uniref:Uncharacterized protein n=1 Tax=Niallia taxi TaxID=2499688 RepID=A0A3S2TSE9_9BACI|nr:hypothetical protein [Niallia taxi]MCM3217408.1 hypothetical protein [Niallia taxi]MCT2343711.1 hypothetical protein [Niallia taxi]MDE5055585.1 hypothetical protein [Niallia taxi]MDK8641397.1 hypothetical protein [Niallia taxi]MED3965340.1 hypothetical protein [Niallia taxi]
MVTFVYLLMIGMMGSLTLILDLFVFHDSLKNCFLNIYKAEVGAGAITIVLTAGFGFIWSVVVDFRRLKKKLQGNKSQAKN